MCRCKWVIADGAYYSIKRTEALSGAGVTPVIPLPAHAVVHGNDQTRWHEQIVKYIEDKGIYAFHKKYGYGLRARVEARISRINHWRYPPEAEDRVAGKRRRGHRQHHQPVERLRLAGLRQKCIVASVGTGTHTHPNKAPREQLDSTEALR
jgi:hypothetical protein